MVLYPDSFGFSNVHCVGTSRPFTDLKLNCISVSNFSSHLGLVDKEVISIFLFDEAEALYLIKPLYFAS